MNGSNGMTKYEIIAINVETQTPLVFEGRYKDARTIQKDFEALGYCVIGCWVAFNQD